jgi:hypothetical protein
LKDSHSEDIPVLLALFSNFLLSQQSLLCYGLHQGTLIFPTVVHKGQLFSLFSYEGRSDMITPVSIHFIKRTQNN